MQNSARFPHMLKAGIFQGLDRSAKVDFIDRCSVLVYPEPTVVLTQGSQSPGMYLVAHGSFEIVYLGEDGQRTFLARAAQGSIVGEAEAISGQVCAATCEVTANTTLLFCPKPMLFEALTSVQFVKNLATVFHGHLLQLNYFKLVDRHSPVDDRLCAYLLMFSERHTKIYDTQAYLAGVVGCSRQTINRELGKLRDEKIINIRKGVIEILDREKLESFLKETPRPAV